MCQLSFREKLRCLSGDSCATQCGGYTECRDALNPQELTQDAGSKPLVDANTMFFTVFWGPTGSFPMSENSTITPSNLLKTVAVTKH